MEEFFNKIGARIVADEYRKCAEMPSDVTSIKTIYSEISSGNPQLHSCSITQELIGGVYVAISTDQHKRERIDTWPYKTSYDETKSNVQRGIKNAMKSIPPMENREFELYKNQVGIASDFVFVCNRTNIGK